MLHNVINKRKTQRKKEKNKTRQVHQLTMSSAKCDDLTEMCEAFK